ncbi:MAG: alpha-1,2-fucosyltransferase [Candidatus Berkelbacteria bacterium]|nr:alpha-1,2-fucosyltransferase [Candidatus Berkelbacteria bacterium]
MTKVIARIRGGLGNQLFCYAAARRLALVNNAELVIDDVTGFARDCQYQRQYMLDRFEISARKATPVERMEPFERYRRGFAKLASKHHSFYKRKYIEQEGIGFDTRLLQFRPKGTVYIDGLWQGEGYFKDIEGVIRQDLRIRPPLDVVNQKMASKIVACDSVCLHVRWFDSPDSVTGDNLGYEYYKNAISHIMARVRSPHFFLFSDNPDEAIRMLSLPEEIVSCIKHNQGDENAYADLWLMKKCKHIVTANSTFSWWGAWLGESESKIILSPGLVLSGTTTAWGFKGLLPNRWTLI